MLISCIACRVVYMEPHARKKTVNEQSLYRTSVADPGGAVAPPLGSIFRFFQQYSSKSLHFCPMRTPL